MVLKSNNRSKHGMAVSQCQHQVKEFADLIAGKYDTEVKYAIHPVAGRMPTHECPTC